MTGKGVISEAVCEHVKTCLCEQQCFLIAAAVGAQFCFAACVMCVFVFVGVVVLDHSHITLQPKTGCPLKQG